VLANQLVQNGVTVPHVDGASAGIEVNAKVVQGDALKHFSGVDDCVPVDDKASAAKKFNSAYHKAYNEDPIYSAAEAYDVVKFAYAAAQKAGSTDPTKLEAQIQKLAYTGACGKYKLDTGNILLHTSYITTWTPAGAEKAGKKLTFPLTGAAGSAATTPTTATPATTTAAK
jgi:branched-chain amino acid transport system substrate-binding protein